MTQWTAGKVLLWAQEDFKKRGIASPRLEAEVLLSEILNIRRLDLYTGFDRPLHENELAEYRHAIVRRRNGEPTAYIVGHREFWSLAFEVTKDVLIPRPDTETLVDAALTRLEDGKRMLDLCTGTGCVAVAVASERPDLLIDAVDLSEAACNVARRNVDKHRFADRIQIHTGDLFAPLEKHPYDLITANPPYIPSGEMTTLQTEVRQEPALALDGGAEGLDIVWRIIETAPHYLKGGGWLLMEVDPRQTETIVSRIPSAWIDTAIVPDLSGQARVVALKRSETPA